MWFYLILVKSSFKISLSHVDCRVHMRTFARPREVVTRLAGEGGLSFEVEDKLKLSFIIIEPYN